jgi:beta-mannosidase
LWERDRALHYPEPASRVEVERRPDGWDVTVTAAALLRDVCLFVDRLDSGAGVDEMLVTLLPGETALFRVTSEMEIDPVALCSPPVLRCVNDVDLLVEPRPGVG